jgi:DNA-binding transcriptional regulator YiaG
MTPADFRTRLGLTQSGAATLFRVTLRAWQHWEAGARNVPGPALVLMELLAARPELVAVITAPPSA